MSSAQRQAEDKSRGQSPLLTREEFEAFRLILAERADEVAQPQLVAMGNRGYVREDRDQGWVVTLGGHRTYLYAVLATFRAIDP